MLIVVASQMEASAGDKRPYRVALITGITGQDGSYLAELLLSKGYHVKFCIHYLIIRYMVLLDVQVPSILNE